MTRQGVRGKGRKTDDTKRHKTRFFKDKGKTTQNELIFKEGKDKLIIKYKQDADS